MNIKPMDFMRGFSVRANRRFLQPVAVALVFLVFGVLFFTMAQLDLRRLERLLMDALKKKALYVAEVVEKSSKEKYRRLMRQGDEYRGLYAGLTIDEEGFYLQEAMARALIDLARFVDSQDLAGTAVQQRLQELAAEENFQAIVLFDQRGLPAHQSNPLPADLTAHARSLTEGGNEVVIHLFHGLNRRESIGYVGVRKHDGRGAVFLALDSKGLKYWAWRVAIQSAIEELQWGRGVVYLAVEDAGGRILARSGSIPEEKVEECLLVAGAARDPASPVGQCVRVGDMKFLELSYPFQLEGNAAGTTRVGIETQETDRLLAENRRHIWLWTGLMVMIGLLAMGLLYQSQNRHVAKFQAMQERLHQAERLSSLGMLGAGVAHEIRNPLNSISMAAQRIQSDYAPNEPGKKEAFNRITHIVRYEIKRLNGIIEDFLGLSRSSRMDLRPQSLIDLLERIVFLAREEAQPKNIQIQKQWSNHVPLIFMDARKMEQAILNIVKNAMESIADEGCVCVGVSCKKRVKNWVIVEIRDTGMGIPEDSEQRIFDPFYTTKDNGVGLGLAIAREIILAHEGEIRVKSEQGRGTAVQVLLPAGREKREAGSWKREEE
ncbi:sensor histidine kinase [Desulfoferrobacter suflitae]|uniref:sensor histidine kinase n=1 Tax=Desulfoferrobacter suflitae TaxID=2865782 RepID=UPI002164CAF8|nr:ATP-binding protein [Desulfoferrobacter suflitae]MCK8603675.1 ATP-binding protein [Desulfoferrobacter suflitae]